MSLNKTVKNKASVKEFINSVEDEQKRNDSKKILKMMEGVTGEKPAMWGESIVGFGDVHHVYESGRELDWFLIGFSPRQKTLTLYFMSGFDDYDQTKMMPKFLKELGKYKTGKSCLYIKKLEDIDLDILKKMMESSVKHVRENHG